MINNFIEIWYWIFMLGAFFGVAIYFSYCYLVEQWAAAKERRNSPQPAPPPGKIVKQYSRRMVTIHWLTLAMFIVVWYLGDILVGARDEHTATMIGYLVHVLLGFAVLLLTALRMNYRNVDGVPATGESLMDMASRVVHHGLYFLLILVSITGFMTMLTSGVGEALVTVNPGALTEEFTGPGIIPHAVHETLVNVIIAAIVVHVLGAVVHQFFIKDNLMRRIWFSKKDSNTA